MLDSVLNNPNITADTVKAMAQEERCATICLGRHSCITVVTVYSCS